MIATVAPSFLDADIADLVLGGTPGALSVSVDRARRLFPGSGTLTEPAFNAGALACAAQLSGLGRALLEMSVSYAKSRVQFGQPIGQFQAVKHRLAEVLIALDFARPLLYAAAASTTTRDISAAKVACGDAAYLAARTALQVHGAIGYTDEFDLSIWFTKVRALVSAWGTPAATPRPGDGGPMNEVDLLRDSVRALLTKQPDKAWERLCAEVGVAGLLVPASFGGAGAGLAEACVVLEELGRVLSPAPMLSTVIATEALLATGNDEACARLLPQIASGARTPTLVWDEHVLEGDLFFVVNDGQLFEAQAVATPLPAMDHTRPLLEVDVQQRGDLLGSFDADRIRDLACVALAAEQVGAAEQALALTVEYAKTRVQFGRPIGAFQALQHRMADLHVLVQTARSAYLAASTATRWPRRSRRSTAPRRCSRSPPK